MMAETVVIRQAAHSDLELLQEIARHTFAEAFLTSNNAADIQKYLEECFSVQALRTELENPLSMFYFAFLGEDLIGYLKLNTGKAQTEQLEGKSLEIQRIYVLRAYYGKKVGQRLYGKAIAMAQAMDADYIWLGVWEENSRAIAFYQKNRFVAFGTHIFKLGDQEQTDLLMKKTLREAGMR